ncbi:hypothetical protein BpHYR1_048658 [Brachionus plicatilis]|uniref:Uncharacterized protein n=1 Tax=Brachionus plicatilis TaxID=10195 RepID=A0A3M7RPS7_BRAPC|nr:hypothetical protein BpHYR1_048658 [Brachionus plicatilis]
MQSRINNAKNTSYCYRIVPDFSRTSVPFRFLYSDDFIIVFYEKIRKIPFTRFGLLALSTLSFAFFVSTSGLIILKVNNILGLLDLGSNVLVQYGKHVLFGLERMFGRLNLGIMNGLASALANPSPVKIHGNPVLLVVRRALLLNQLVDGQRRLRLVHVPDAQTALLQP